MAVLSMPRGSPPPSMGAPPQRRARAASMLAVHRLGGSPYRRLEEEGLGDAVACELLTPGGRCRGQLAVGKAVLRFTPEREVLRAGEHASEVENEWRKAIQSRNHDWKVADLVEVRGRRFRMCDTALELFFLHAPPVLFHFPDAEPLASQGAKSKAETVHLRLVKAVPRPLRIHYSGVPYSEDVQRVQSQWVQRRISNFEYLMALNTLAGRTYNDLSQYPVFPWVLRDYSSAELDLSDAASFRDLARPIGAQTLEHRAELLKRFMSWDPDLGQSPRPTHYGPWAHFSQPMDICSLLVRLEPFTSLRVGQQDGTFDVPDRIFNSIAQQYESSKKDISELTPEFFILPEVLLNSSKHNFGRRQDNREVDHVELPPWAKGSAHRFIRMHRQALESEHVSANLHRWIDLIFGFQQASPNAEHAFNLYNWIFYHDSAEETTLEERAFLEEVGQMPLQLFSTPHPARKTLFDAPVAVFDKVAHPDFPRMDLLDADQSDWIKAAVSDSERGGVLAAQWCSDAVLMEVDARGVLRAWTWGLRRLQAEASDAGSAASSGSGGLGMGSMGMGSMGMGSMASMGTSTVRKITTALWWRANGEACSARTTLQLRHRCQLPYVAEARGGAVAVRQGRSAEEWVAVAGGKQDGSVAVYSGRKEAGRAIGEKRLHPQRITCLSLSGGDEREGAGSAVLFSGGEEGTVRVWRLEVSAPLKSKLPSLEFSTPPASVTLADTPEAILCCHQGAVTCLAVSEALALVLSGSADHSCSLSRIVPGKYAHVRTLKLPPPPPGRVGGVGRVLLTSEGEVVMYSGAWRKVFLSDVNGAPVTDLRGEEVWSKGGEARVELGEEEVSALAATPSGQCLVCGSADGKVSVWDLRSRRLVQRLALRECDYLLVGFEDGTLQLVTATAEIARRRTCAFELKRKNSFEDGV